MKVIPSGIGMWLWKPSQCENGDWNKIITKCKSGGVKWIAVKSGDTTRYAEWSSEHMKEVINLCHTNGILFLTWNYSIPTTWQAQVEQIKSLFTDGVDGHVINAEIEWQAAANTDAAAEAFMQSLRTECGDAFIAHAPFAIIDYHSQFPYETFGKYVDAVMPQAYWTEYNWKVERIISEMNLSWAKFNAANPESAKPVWPIGVTYGQGYPGVHGILVPEDVKTFLSYYNAVPVSLYSYDASAGFGAWDVLRELAPPVVLPEPVKKQPKLLVFLNTINEMFRVLLGLK